MSTYGGLYAWEFARDEKKLQAHVQGQLTFNTTQQKLEAALGGYGLAYVPEDIICRYVEEGRLVKVLEDWCPSFPGYHIYYPSRRQPSPAFTLVVNALRYEA